MIELPSYERIEAALVAYFEREQCAASPSAVYPQLAVDLGLTPNQLALQRPDGKGSLFENRVQWAREALAKRGIIERGIRGIWMLRPKPKD